MTGIAIKKVDSVTQNDPRGETYELFKGLPGVQVSFYKRKQGVKFACHFHKGEDPSKDPELFFLLSGKVKIMAENGFTGEVEEMEVEEGNMVIIEKGVYHEFEAITDASFLEYRSTLFDKNKPDCFSKEEYESYINALIHP